MEAKQESAATGKSESRISNGGEVVVLIPTEEATSEKKTPKPTPATAASPEAVDRFSPSPNRPPKIPTLTKRKSLPRSAFSKPKSRFGEQPVQIDPNMLEMEQQTNNNNNNVNMTLQEQFVTSSPFRTSINRGSPYNKSATVSFSGTPGREREAEAEEIYRQVKESRVKKSKVKTKILVELVTLFCIVGCLVASLTVRSLVKHIIWGLEVWKWCVLVLVTFCGLLVTNWFMNVVVFLIERNFLLKNKVLYFVYGLKQSVQVFLWFCLILLTWVLLFNRGVDRSELALKILNYVTWTIVSLLIGSFLWLLKTLLLKILASNCHLNRFFERTQESIYHLYILQTLSGPPLIEEAERVGRSPSMGRLSLNRTNKNGKKGKEKKQVIDMYSLHKMKREKVSSWYMKTLVDAVTSPDVNIISNSLQSFDDGEGQELASVEMQATAAAYQIFKNVAQPGAKYIEVDDLLRFMIKEEVDLVFPLFEVDESGRIGLQSLTNWVVKVYQGRKALAHALSDTKTAVKQLNKLIAGAVIILTIIVWFLLTEVAPTKVLVLFSSQLVVAAFIFGNTCKTTFEGIIFVFVMHPFDVGDRCVIDGLPLLVEEMNILSTVFLKLDNEKVYYPNSVLSTKPISNYYRSPHMGDNVEFSIAFTTPMEKIGLLKEKIKKYLEENPHHWYPNHMVVVKEIENVNKIKMALFFNHTMNYQDIGEKTRRRTDLVLHLKTIFEDLAIKYDLLHQEIRLAHVRSETNLDI